MRVGVYPGGGGEPTQDNNYEHVVVVVAMVVSAAGQQTQKEGSDAFKRPGGTEKPQQFQGQGWYETGGRASSRASAATAGSASRLTHKRVEMHRVRSPCGTLCCSISGVATLGMRLNRPLQKMGSRLPASPQARERCTHTYGALPVLYAAGPTNCFARYRENAFSRHTTPINRSRLPHELVPMHEHQSPSSAKLGKSLHPFRRRFGGAESVHVGK